MKITKEKARQIIREFLESDWKGSVQSILSEAFLKEVEDGSVIYQTSGEIKNPIFIMFFGEIENTMLSLSVCKDMASINIFLKNGEGSGCVGSSTCIAQIGLDRGNLHMRASLKEEGIFDLERVAKIIGEIAKEIVKIRKQTS